MVKNNILLSFLEKNNVLCQKLCDQKFDQSMQYSFNKYYESIFDVMSILYADPSKLVEHQIKYCNSQLMVLENIFDRYYEKKTDKPLIEVKKKDNRFIDKTWESDPFFNYIKQSYLLINEWLEEISEDLKKVNKHDTQKMYFYLKQYINAMAPTNFILTNPEVLKKCLESGGNNLVKGLENFINDIQKDGTLKIKTYDEKKYKLGENIANTPGKVIFQNDLMQLIHYKPISKKVFERPMLIVPPWINKYYILDLGQKKSFVYWLISQGYDVYLISWINPNESLSHKDFEDYMQEGPIAAINAIKKNTGQSSINTIGYCIGGTLLACTVSYLTTKKKDYIKSATFLTTIIDYKNAGDLSLFIDNDHIKLLESYIKKKGYLDGIDMYTTFSALKPNDMIWHFFVHNYLLGEDPSSFGLLYWNADSTRLPMKMYLFYLKKIYRDNLLIKKANGIKLSGENINISDIKIPCYFISTIDDHIAPWQNTYTATHLIKDSTFVLTSSGHVAGIINPPHANKYCYWTNDKLNNSSADQWFEESEKKNGSWWKHWHEWCKNISGKKISVEKIKNSLPKIEEAPGSYVKIRY